MNEVIQKLRAVKNALCDVEVKGPKNMDILLGSIQAMDWAVKMLVQLSQKEKTESDDNVDAILEIESE